MSDIKQDELFHVFTQLEGEKIELENNNRKLGFDYLEVVSKFTRKLITKYKEQLDYIDKNNKRFKI